MANVFHRFVTVRPKIDRILGKPLAQYTNNFRSTLVMASVNNNIIRDAAEAVKVCIPQHPATCTIPNANTAA